MLWRSTTALPRASHLTRFNSVERDHRKFDSAIVRYNFRHSNQFKQAESEWRPRRERQSPRQTMRASHHVGARHRYQTWQLRSAPCLSAQPDRSSGRKVCTCRIAKRVWACGSVDNAKRRCPQTHRPNSRSSSRHQFGQNEKAATTAAASPRYGAGHAP